MVYGLHGGGGWEAPPLFCLGLIFIKTLFPGFWHGKVHIVRGLI
jgi:hypothetical protein